MRFFLLNIFLAMIWTMLQGRLSAADFIAGFALGYLVIGLIQRLLGSGNYSQKVVQVVRFVAFVAWDIFTASLALAWLMLQPKPRLSPAVIAIPLDVKTDLEIVLLANLITLSPGTLSVDVSSDNSTLYVHTINHAGGDAMTVALNIAALVLVFSTALCFVRLYKGPSLPDRVVALDQIGIHVAALVAVYTIQSGKLVFLDAVVVAALLAFLTTVAFARYLEQSIKS